ncbi:unnamed protein product [Rangifer tarandus platyrhynchus]|uniref:Uncharacterized protein n=2 Tax=Rangifer tarandus platyrhynchus TaxID=3082113 RepID=A0ACB0E958_RANTA|nr:unnamed protein product [Rangifer tarandus platyrhynchus]CAI9696979.1 unnamed protein product [Rangifer tarandus platyrhynchus]
MRGQSFSCRSPIASSLDQYGAHNGPESAGGRRQAHGSAPSPASRPEQRGRLLSGRLRPAAQPLLARNCGFPPQPSGDHGFYKFLCEDSGLRNQHPPSG